MTIREHQIHCDSAKRVLAAHGIIQSVFRPGNLYDNADAESFLYLNTELTKGRKYADQEEARQEIFKYIELYYITIILIFFPISVDHSTAVHERGYRDRL
jgi:hypothetical protein